MKYIDTDIIQISILGAETVLAESRKKVWVELNHEKYILQLIDAYQLIENAMTNDYGMIIDRNSHYSIVPVDAYNVFNRFKRLKAIALAINDERRKYFPVSFEQDLYQGEMKVFQTVGQARNWIKKMLNESIMQYV